MQLILFGAPGVGKGTQAKLLSNDLVIPHISTGDILRNAVKNKTEYGLKAKAIIDSGELVPDDIMGKIIECRLAEEDTLNGFILDGFPRTVAQAELLEKIFEEKNITNPKLVVIKSDDEIIINRLSNRRNCSQCGSIVNLLELEIKFECPHCGTKDSFVKREDDEEEVIRRRFKVYNAQTAPVLKFYEGRYEFLEVNGTQSVKQVSADIKKALGK